MSDTGTYSDLLDLAKKKLNDNDFSGAINTYQKVISLKPCFDAYLQLGIAQFNASQYEEAKKSLQSSIEIQKHWLPHHLLGWIYYNQKKINKSISSFQGSLAVRDHAEGHYGLAMAYLKNEEISNSIKHLRISLDLAYSTERQKLLVKVLMGANQFHLALQEINLLIESEINWDALQQKGICHYHLSQFNDSAKSLLQSITLKKDQKSFKLLGSCYSKLGKCKLAIKAFHDSIALQEGWNNCQCLGWEYLKAKDFAKSEEYFRKSIHLRPVGSVYRGLGIALSALGKKDEAREYFGLHLDRKKPVALIDSTLGLGKSRFDISLETLRSVKSACRGLGYSFYPSEIIKEESSLMSWRNLMYLHIPKCAGSSFKVPFYMLFDKLISSSERAINTGNSQLYMNTRGLISDYDMLSGLKRIATRKKNEGLSSIFFTTAKSPPPSWHETYSDICKLSNSESHVVVITRDPRERLLSHIKWESSHFTLDTMLERINSKNCIMNNTMYNFIYQSPFSSDVSEEERLESVNSFDFVDISNNEFLSQIKAAFLSSSGLPNIVQVEKMNSSEFNSSNLSDAEIQELFNTCLSKGYVEKDEAIDLSRLHSETLHRHIDAFKVNNMTLSSLHPLTFIVRNDCNNYMGTSSSGQLVKTSDFCNDPLKFLS